jgi:hypothetical protein
MDVGVGITAPHFGNKVVKIRDTIRTLWRIWTGDDISVSGCDGAFRENAVDGDTSRIRSKEECHYRPIYPCRTTMDMRLCNILDVEHDEREVELIVVFELEVGETGGIGINRGNLFIPREWSDEKKRSRRLGNGDSHRNAEDDEDEDIPTVLHHDFLLSMRMHGYTTCHTSRLFMH